jgi:hypothetical protein
MAVQSIPSIQNPYNCIERVVHKLRPDEVRFATVAASIAPCSAARNAATVAEARVRAPAGVSRPRSRTSSKASISPPTAACGSMVSGSLPGHPSTGGPGTVDSMRSGYSER